MDAVAYVLAGLVAALHLYFLVLEMFLWTKPAGRKAFGLDADFALQTKVLAASQGLHNGFLVAGAFGAATVSRKILFVQAVPALLALGALALA